MEREGFEDPRRRTKPRLEPQQNPEILKLEAVIEGILIAGLGDPGLPPTRGEKFRLLEMILEAEPQRNAAGILRYLVTSGMAVEMVTGYERPHHDLDLVIMDPDNEAYWSLIGTDNVTPGKYWADMQFDAAFLEQTAREARTRKKGKFVEVVHPGIIMVQKASDAFGRPPRQKDQEDVAAIVRHWKGAERYSWDWNPIVETSLNALPPRQLDRTLGRLRRAVK